MSGIAEGMKKLQSACCEQYRLAGRYYDWLCIAYSCVRHARGSVLMVAWGCAPSGPPNAITQPTQELPTLMISARACTSHAQCFARILHGKVDSLGWRAGGLAKGKDRVCRAGVSGCRNHLSKYIDVCTLRHRKLLVRPLLLGVSHTGARVSNSSARSSRPNNQRRLQRVHCL